MIRQITVALGLGLVTTLTVLMLRELGVFSALEEWLRQRYEQEALLSAGTANEGRAGILLSVVISSLSLAWLGYEAGSLRGRWMLYVAMMLMLGFFSLTSAFYGVFFAPWAGQTAGTLGFVGGLLAGGTTSVRSRRLWAEALVGRAMPETINALADQQNLDELRGEWTELAVMHVRLLDALPSVEAVSDYLRSQQAALQEATDFLLQQPGVVLDQTMPEGVRAFFGLTKPAHEGPREAPPVRVAQCALSLLKYLDEFNELQRTSGQPELRVGIGLASGPLVFGWHGPAEASVLTAVGVPADQARQLSIMNTRHQTRVLVSIKLAEQIKDFFELRELTGSAAHELLRGKEIAQPQLTSPEKSSAQVDKPELNPLLEEAIIPPSTSLGTPAEKWRRHEGVPENDKMEKPSTEEKKPEEEKKSS